MPVTSLSGTNWHDDVPHAGVEATPSPTFSMTCLAAQLQFLPTAAGSQDCRAVLLMHPAVSHCPCSRLTRLCKPTVDLTTLWNCGAMAVLPRVTTKLLPTAFMPSACALHKPGIRPLAHTSLPLLDAWHPPAVDDLRVRQPLGGDEATRVHGVQLQGGASPVVNS